MLNSGKTYMLRIKSERQGNRKPGLWVPKDVFLGFAIDRNRLFDVPTVLGECCGERYSLRVECWLLLNIVFIVDFRKC